jgi:peptide deformylase
MPILKLRKFPDEILRKDNSLITEVKKQEKKLFNDMLDTMYKFGGIGLAAPQVGENCQIFVAEVGSTIYKVANPKIIEVSGQEKMVEGCLSVPDFSAEVERFYSVILQGINENGEEISIEASGMLARVFQHEIDHLNGKLIVDYHSKQNIFKL